MAAKVIKAKGICLQWSYASFIEQIATIRIGCIFQNGYLVNIIHCFH